MGSRNRRTRRKPKKTPRKQRIQKKTLKKALKKILKKQFKGGRLDYETDEKLKMRGQTYRLEQHVEANNDGAIRIFHNIRNRSEKIIVKEIPMVLAQDVIDLVGDPTIQQLQQKGFMVQILDEGEFFLENGEGYYMYAMEPCSGSLEGYIRQLDPTIIQQFKGAFDVLHDVGYVHRDIKLDNALLCNSQVKIGDIDTIVPRNSIRFSGNSELVTTYPYFPFHMYYPLGTMPGGNPRRNPFKKRTQPTQPTYKYSNTHHLLLQNYYTEITDRWGMGLTMWELYTGKPVPFIESDDFNYLLHECLRIHDILCEYYLTDRIDISHPIFKIAVDQEMTRQYNVIELLNLMVEYCIPLEILEQLDQLRSGTRSRGTRSRGTRSRGAKSARAPRNTTHRTRPRQTDPIQELRDAISILESQKTNVEQQKSSLESQLDQLRGRMDDLTNGKTSIKDEYTTQITSLQAQIQQLEGDNQRFVDGIDEIRQQITGLKQTIRDKERELKRLKRAYGSSEKNTNKSRKHIKRINQHYTNELNAIEIQIRKLGDSITRQEDNVRTFEDKIRYFQSEIDRKQNELSDLEQSSPSDNPSSPDSGSDYGQYGQYGQYDQYGQYGQYDQYGQYGQYGPEPEPESQSDDSDSDSDSGYEFAKERNYDPYKILGINKDDDNKTIKKTYHTLAVKYHPDKVRERGGDNEAVEKATAIFKQVNTAYELLKDEGKRLEYDQNLQEESAKFIFINAGG